MTTPTPQTAQDPATATAASRHRPPAAYCPACGHRGPFPALGGLHPWLCPGCYRSGSLAVLQIDGTRPCCLGALVLPPGWWQLPEATAAQNERSNAQSCAGATAVRCRDCAHAFTAPGSAPLCFCSRIRGGHWLNRLHTCQAFTPANHTDQDRDGEALSGIPGTTGHQPAHEPAGTPRAPAAGNAVAAATHQAQAAPRPRRHHPCGRVRQPPPVLPRKLWPADVPQPQPEEA